MRNLQEDELSKPPERYADYSTRELVQEMVGEGQKLVREEIELAKTELREQAKKATSAGRNVAIGGVVAHTGILVLAACLVLLLAEVLEPWFAALLVGAVLAIGGALYSRSQMKKFKELEPKQTIETLKEDSRWARQSVRGMKLRTQGNA